MTAGGGPHPGQSADDRARCRLAGELLQSGQYEQAAAVLSVAQEHSARAGDAFMAHFLDAARQLCLACEQCQEEAERHRQATQEVERREQELRQELDTILDLLGSGERPGTPLEAEPHLSILQPKSAQLGAGPLHIAVRPWLLQRLQSLLRKRPPRSLTMPASLGTSAKKAEQAPSERAVPSPASELVGLVEKRASSAAPSLVVYCLGPFRVYQDDRPVDNWPSSRGKSLFKYMVTHSKHPVAKEVLMELFWPDRGPDAARNNLNVAIYGLRQALRQVYPSFPHVLFSDGCYILNPEMDVWVDCEAFEEHVLAAQALEQRGELAAAMRMYRAAEMLYQGEFLEEDRYEDWPLSGRQHLQELYLNLLSRLSAYCCDRGDYAACVTFCRKMLAVDPCHEEAHRRLMRCYCQQGQVNLALRQYYLCVERLQEELGVPPSDETTHFYKQIRRTETSRST